MTVMRKSREVELVKKKKMDNISHIAAFRFKQNKRPIGNSDHISQLRQLDRQEPNELQLTTIRNTTVTTQATFTSYGI